ncbi:MAG: hypothetical protein ACR2QO_29105 [Acidimicrobiales bacterium]
MSGTHLLLRLIHIGFGFAVLVLFWIPISSRKGGRTHRSSGQLYLWLGRVVVATAIISCLWAQIDPAERIGSGDLERDREGVIADVRFFFGLLGVLALAALTQLEQGVFIIRRSAARSARTWLLVVATVTGVTALVLAGWGVLTLISGGTTWHGLVRLAMAAFGLGLARSTLATARGAYPTGRERQVAHLDAMLGSGVAFYTAFGVFGFGRLLGLDVLEGGPIAFLPWIAPAIVGTVLTRWWKRRITAPTKIAPRDITQQPTVGS